MNTILDEKNDHGKQNSWEVNEKRDKCVGKGMLIGEGSKGDFI